ncbi:tRNA epoxyqueuosine(34) reductase QueG [Ferrovibrio sp.]|uniref:tRNA epoxyqueuosine(34) reductase QueG n=1 Tax=Ferrovibrio sp. TaxID=1917215 RepID=UPI003D128615
MTLAGRIRARAEAEGFDAVGIAAVADIGAEHGARLDRFVELGRHGEMLWLAEGERAPRRRHPANLWPEARSIIALGLNYGPTHDPLRILQQPDRAAISVYAQGRDYHLVVKKKLKALGQWLQRESGQPLKVFVDTAPLMEKPLAQASGLGWQGKHTNLVSRQFGSWLFLGAILTAADLEADAPEPDHCGSCQACLDICPTKAFPAPYELDARRCISYLTIEFDGVIGEDFRKPMGNRIYGCDDCLAACPWNKFAQAARDAEIQAQAELKAPSLLDLAKLDDAGFRDMFARTAVKRIGRDRFIRNVCIALGNSGDAAAIPDLLRLSEDPAMPVRALAAWALKQLMPAAQFEQHAAKRRALEQDAAVLAELR